MKKKLFLSIIALFVLLPSIQAKTLFKCIINDTIGDAPAIDEILFTFERDKRDTVFDDGMVDIYWSGRSVERIESDGRFMYSFKKEYVGMSYEGQLNATILLNDSSKYEYWHKGSMLIRREHYYLIKCVEYHTI